MDNEKLNHALRSKADNLKNLADTIASLSNDHNTLQNKFDDLTSENKNLMDSLQLRIDQVAQLKSDLENVKMVGHFFLHFFFFLLICKPNT